MSIGCFQRVRFRPYGRGPAKLLALLVLISSGAGRVHATEHDGYGLVERFTLPAGSGPIGALPDGRLVTLVDADLYVETASGTRAFAFHGTLPAADMASFGAAFIRMSPDGTMMAVGNNGGADFMNLQVGVFAFPSLVGDWFNAGHFDAAWTDATHVALTTGEFGSPSRVTLLDTTSVDPSNPTNPTLIDNIGGASGGVAIDAQGNLFTGNGFTIAGPSGTGLVKAFSQAAWMAAAVGSPIDFEANGVVIVDVLSASPLGFDGVGNLLVGGGDFSAAGQSDYVAVVSASAIASALAGNGPVNVLDFDQVRRLDPDFANNGNFFTFAYGALRGEIYVNDFGDLRTHVFRDLMGIPAVSQWGLLTLALALAVAATLTLDRSRRRAWYGEAR